MIFLNQFSFSDMFFPLVTVVTAVTPYSHAACAVTSTKNAVVTVVTKLTLSGFKTILATLAHMQGGNITPKTLGFNKPLLNVVFLCSAKTIQAGFIRLKSCYGGLCRELERVAVPRFGCDNPTQSATQRLSPLLAVKSSLSRTTAMNTQTSSATAPQNHTQDLAQLNKAFLKLCSSIGIANNKAPENLTSGNFDMIATDTDELLQIANALFSQKLTADRAFKQALFDTVPMENQQA